MVALAGGIGGARFLLGLRAVLGYGDELTVICNTGDDITLHGLQICPDLDTVMYTLGDGIDAERGWGRRDETFTVAGELAAYGVGPAWFGLGDRDLATHLVRTRLLDTGHPLSAVTETLCARWDPSGGGPAAVSLVPMSDQRVETHVVVDTADGTREAIHFQQWWLEHHAKLPARAFVQVGVDTALPAPGVLPAIAAADIVILAPSNPVVSIGTILGVPGIRDAVVTGPAPTVGLSPIIGGAPVRGMADACLAGIGVPTTAEAVGRHYGARGTQAASPANGTDRAEAREMGVLDAWLVDTVDAGADVPGVAVHALPLLMADAAATRSMARTALQAVQ